MAELTGLPKLVITPEYKKPLQGKGKPDKIMRNGQPNQRDISAQLFGRGGGLHSRVITKSLSRSQKGTVAANAGLGAALTYGSAKRAVQYGRSARNLKQDAGRTSSLVDNRQFLSDAKYMRRMSGRNAKVVAGSALVSGGLSAGLMAGQNAVRDHRARKRLQPVAKMTDVELRRRKKLAGNIAMTTSTVGLGGLGLLGAGVALKKPRLTKIATTGSIVNGGIGGAGGYNFAAINRAEAKKRPVAKGWSRQQMDEMTQGGKIRLSRAIGLTGPPVSKAFDAERNRQNRARNQTKAAATVGAAGLGGAGYLGGKGGRQLNTARKLKRDSNNLVMDGFRDSSMAQTSDHPFRSRKKGKTKLGNYDMPYFRPPTSGERLANGGSAAGKLRKVAHLNLKRSGGLAALGIGGMVAADRIASYSQGKGKTYQPRYRRPE